VCVLPVSVCVCVCSPSKCVCVCVFPAQGDLLHQAAAAAVPQAVLLLPGLLHPLLSQDALQGMTFTLGSGG